MIKLDKYKELTQDISTFREVGKVIQIIGLVIEADGPNSRIGDLCYIYNEMDKPPIWAEVVGFKTNKVLLTFI